MTQFSSTYKRQKQKKKKNCYKTHHPMQCVDLILVPGSNKTIIKKHFK